MGKRRLEGESEELETLRGKTEGKRGGVEEREREVTIREVGGGGSRRRRK